MSSGGDEVIGEIAIDFAAWIGIGNPKATVVVMPEPRRHKVKKDHPVDYPYLNRAYSILRSPTYVGLKPGSVDRVEFYGRIDGIWFIVPLEWQDDRIELISFYRKYERTVASRLRRKRIRALDGLGTSEI